MLVEVVRIQRQVVVVEVPPVVEAQRQVALAALAVLAEAAPVVRVAASLVLQGPQMSEAVQAHQKAALADQAE